MAIAWVIPSEISLPTLFPEVIFPRAVEETNKEGILLSMISGKETNGKFLTILCIFLPNEQS